MRRIPATLERRCRGLRQEGFSIGQIAGRLKLAESTVHRDVRGIRLTRAQRDALFQQWKRRLTEVNGLRRGIAVKRVACRRPRWSAEFVHLVAHLAFDGRVDRYGCHYYSRERSAVLHFARLMEQLLHVRPRVRRRSNGMSMASFFHVEIAAWLAKRERELLLGFSHSTADGSGPGFGRCAMMRVTCTGLGAREESVPPKKM